MWWAGEGPHNPAERMMSCVRRSTKVLSARLFFLLEEGLGYGLVVPFPAYGFAALVSHNESLNSLNRSLCRAVQN